MINSIERKWIQFLAIVSSVSVALFISPSFSNEPIDQAKMFILVPFAALLFGFTLNNLSAFKNKKFIFAGALLGAFLLDLVLILFLSGAEFNQQFFGANGRNTGFLSYLSLTFLFLSLLIVSTKNILKSFSVSLLVTGVVSLSYGYLQYFKSDPIKWNNPYNSIIEFLGNPDFSSAFMGIAATVGLAVLLSPKQKPLVRILLIGYEILNLYLVKSTHAQQGIIVLGICFAFTSLIFITKNLNAKRIVICGYAALVSILGTVVLLGIFRIGPLSKYLYKISVRQRGFYWHAALKMMEQHPLTGVGLDSYGDHYFQVRSSNAAFHTMQTQSNAAHNVFLDLGANGGIPLFLIYTSLCIYIFLSGVKVLRAESFYNTYFIAIFGAWIGYESQSIVSINNLGLAVWGWGLGGLIVGYSIFGISKPNLMVQSEGQKRKVRIKKDRIRLSYPAITFCIGLAIVVPNFMTDHDYRVALASRNVNNVVAAASRYPEDLNRTLNAASLLASSKLFPDALALAKHVVSKNPLNFNAWVLISQLTQVSDPVHAHAIQEMKSLNPKDKSIK